MRVDTLNNLNIDEDAVIISNDVMSSNRKNLINLGISDGSSIKCLYSSPFGDPRAYVVKNVILAIRNDDASNIFVLRNVNGSY